MSWDKIKKSLNSTLGTPDFKPLDEILIDIVGGIRSDLENGVLIPKKCSVLDELEKMGEYKNGTYRRLKTFNADQYLIWITGDVGENKTSFAGVCFGNGGYMLAHYFDENSQDVIPFAFYGVRVGMTDIKIYHQDTSLFDLSIYAKKITGFSL